MDKIPHNVHSFSHRNTQMPASTTTQPQSNLGEAPTLQSQTSNQQLSSSNAASTAPRQQTVDNYPHQITGSGGPTATAPFLQDFSLVAEAARRAQMSVMMRDLEGITL